MIYTYEKVLIIGNGYESSGGGGGGSTSWSSVLNKPLKFPAETHDNTKHSVDYATQSDINQAKSVFIQDDNPNISKGIWIQTGLGSGGDDFSIWFEDGK